VSAGGGASSYRVPNRILTLSIAVTLAAAPGAVAQERPPADSTRPDSVRRFDLPAVSVTRADRALARVPLAVHAVDRIDVQRGRQTVGLDEALAQVPGVHVANRFNFSVDQRLSIRGFGSRSAFSVRGVKLLLDGIPQTLPDGQSQLTNLDLAAVERIEVLRGASSALYGNASGGVVSLQSGAAVPGRWTALAEVGALDPNLNRTWNKWHASGAAGLGGATAQASVSRLWWAGFRQHSTAELWRFTTRVSAPLGRRVTASAHLAVGSDPKADNPGGLTAAELAANRDSASAANLAARAGKEVQQVQAGAVIRAALGSTNAQVALFALTRDLENPLPQAYITFDRLAYGLRLTATRPLSLGARAVNLTAGLDAQWQEDDRLNYANVAGRPDTGDVRLDQLERATEVGPFVEGMVELSPTLGVTAGARYDRVSFRVRDRLVSNGDDSGRRLMDALSGVLGVNLEPRTGLSLYANLSTAFETPTTTELVNRPDGQGGLNPDLDPQRAVSVEIGARGSAAPGIPRVRSGQARLPALVSWSAALFQADVRDELVSFEDTLVPGRRFFRNAGRARHRGVELGGRVQVATGVRIAAAYTFADYRYTDYTVDGNTLDGRPIPGIPQHLIYASVRVEPAWSPGAWLEVDGTHSSSALVDDTLILRTPKWGVVNVRAGWEGSAGGRAFAPFVGINNVLDRKYVGSVAVNAARGRYFEPAARRNLYFGLRVETR
jgi:iron complex outermembrane recepter protein